LLVVFIVRLVIARSIVASTLKMNVGEFRRRFAARTCDGELLLDDEEMADFLAPIYQRFRSQAQNAKSAGRRFWPVTKQVLPDTYNIEAIQRIMPRSIVASTLKMNVEEFRRRFAARTRGGELLLDDEEMADFLAPIYQLFQGQAENARSAGLLFWPVANRVLPDTYNIKAIQRIFQTIRRRNRRRRGNDNGDQGTATGAAEGSSRAIHNDFANEEVTANAVGPQIVAVTRRVADAIREVQGPLNEEQAVHLFYPFFELVRRFAGSNEAASRQMQNTVLRMAAHRRLQLTSHRASNDSVERDDTTDDDDETNDDADNANYDTNDNEDDEDSEMQVEEEDDSEGEDFRHAYVIHRRSLPLNRRRRPGSVIFDEEDTRDNDAAHVYAEGENERDESPSRMSTQSVAKSTTPIGKSFLEEDSGSDDDDPNLVEAFVAPSLWSTFRSLASVTKGTGVPAHFGKSLI
jgi:hypothetical protein